MTDVAENMWYKLGQGQLDIFQNNCEAYFELLVTGLNQRVIMTMFYSVCVRFKLLMPIEMLPDSDKRDLWESTKDIAGGRLDNYQCIELSKCLYTIQRFLTK